MNSEDQIESEINNARETFTHELDEFKKMPGDLAAVIKSATAYRQALQELFQVGQKLGVEYQKLGERYPQIAWANELTRRGFDQEKIEMWRFTWQIGMWDNCILPLLDSSDTDQRDYQALDKQLRSINNQLDNKVKKEKKEFQRQTKRANDPQGSVHYETVLKEVKEQQEGTASYFRVYKERQYHKWLSFLCQATEAQKDFYSASSALLSPAPWKQLVVMETPELPELTTVEALPVGATNTRKSQAPLSPPLETPVGHPISSMELPSGAVKVGWMTKRGSVRKSWKYRFFVLRPDSLEYYRKSTGLDYEKPLGTLLLSECDAVVENTSMKRANCFEMQLPHRTLYLYCETRREMESWFSAIKDRVDSYGTNAYALDFVRERKMQSNQGDRKSVV